MPKAQKQAAAIGGSADEIEASFYAALQAGDIEKLMACWADEDDIVCVHPGGPRLVGLGAIRSAFDAIFSHGSLRVQPQAVRKIESLASAVHSVRECIEVLTEDGPVQAFVIATNVYHRTAQGWRLVAHHASPGSQHEAQDGSEASPVLH
ncbi:MAG: nuclear transport factor 2 family protein [Rhodoferax sp.]|uniref:YybH family protein n=1 Tax=Rhodoferax sp. TaxID=50421 RepID=UPI001400BA66|nr:nuclear transport factor 2 family protein [Rhodoferax sp.]NDP38712.1 nuclear transport factor 2 family protein [Rhodoferax sp.]